MPRILAFFNINLESIAKFCHFSDVMWLNCNLGKVTLELMLPAVLPMLHMNCGTPLGVHRGRSRRALLSSVRCGPLPFCLRFSLAFVCRFFLSCCFHITPLSTQTSQATLLVETQSDGNLPCLHGENSMPVSSTLLSGALNSSVAANPSSQSSPEFLATVVQSRPRTLFQKQISRTFPGLFKDSN